VTAAALAAGVGWLQYRHKAAAPEVRRAQAGQLRELTRRYGARLIVNDDPALAQAVQADGVHLGRDDAAALAVKLGWPRAIVGVSCYADLPRALAAHRDGADYVAFGSVFASRTKRDAVRAPLALLTRARTQGLRTVAIGGIDAGNIGTVAGAGAHAAAVISAVYDAALPDLAARELIEQWSRGREAYERGPQPDAV
jgi:thiamine-phosphate pyrophosphorylase